MVVTGPTDLVGRDNLVITRHQRRIAILNIRPFQRDGGIRFVASGRLHEVRAVRGHVGMKDRIGAEIGVSGGN